MKFFWQFYDRMTVHRNRFLVNKTNRCTEFQFYWYYYSACFGQPFCPSPGVLSHTSALVHLCSCDNLLPGIEIQCICWSYSQGVFWQLVVEACQYEI